MEYIDYREFKLNNSIVCLGKFDGLHIGHQKLIKCAEEIKKDDLQTVIFSFQMDPRLLSGNENVKFIYTKEEKHKLMETYGVDYFISYPFDEAMFGMEAETFVKEILVEQLGVKHIVVGTDFRFGYKRKGDVELLKKLSDVYGYEVMAVEKVSYEGDIVSSTRIRECIENGEIELANAMLGMPYTIMGEVLHGRKLGRTLGMPTANMVPADEKILPPNGVYASRTWIGDKAYYGISNVGVKPTVGAEENKLIETFIFDFAGDLYGQWLKVELYTFERPEQKFSSIEELKHCMEQDTLFGKKYFRLI